MFKMLGDRVAIALDVTHNVDSNSALTKSEGGLLLLTKTVETTLPASGTVVNCGPGLRNLKDGTLIPMQVKVGDKVCFPRAIGELHKIEGKEYLVLRDTDITFISQELPIQS